MALVNYSLIAVLLCCSVLLVGGKRVVGGEDVVEVGEPRNDVVDEHLRTAQVFSMGLCIRLKRTPW